ncbi:hypothetical protein AMES_9017 [Amycolatopsis mediterranei S699]|uniref:Uncharacterized protein n=2 Tax=Amycolatopsis mediterranei TaxID=33910 RepID=A0A0H3DKU5_AMYMU|nr:hypothetical protein [Amycolatopsis mediterranei]ADJ50842.1 hypothetical protein AMED_9153 [Amycolatopsis mediterranei U32]AEK47854.1 hypothetical protein RAM_46945 [Amycolatopsis mediterranei S699]AFO82549.1 hypothetical protein AMES_9017 [Amycolatopsis mediterranei S699]AGT89678.1 hypothetical protein B737_9018 [Amycolatopsis mediterranei RB]KDO12164.1 hypothetical protein DV26_03695 [Amycolatopsis mediterranei]
MGKHSRRKSGYLPKVAAGAAPVALLFAAPATALATQTDVTLPLDRISLPVDHRHGGTLDRDISTATENETSSAREAITATRHDFVAKEVAGALLINNLSESAAIRREGWQNTTDSSERESESLVRTSQHALRLGRISATTANSQRLGQGASRDLALSPGQAGSTERRLGIGEGTSHGIWLPEGIDVLSQNAEQFDTGLHGTFAGDLQGALSARRSSGQAVDLGRLGGVGATSEQYAAGQIAGVLDVGQKHEAGGQLGPAWGLAKTSQSVDAAGPAGSIRGDLGVDHVIHAEGGTTSVRGTLDRSASLSALDRPVLGF